MGPHVYIGSTHLAPELNPILTDTALSLKVSDVHEVRIDRSKLIEDLMIKRTEYLIIQYASDCSIIKRVRAPNGVNLRLLLERLICQDLDDNAVVNSCLRSNAKRYHDPFQIIDMREEHRREQARAALNADSKNQDRIGVYNRARDAQIQLGKTLMVAGVNHDYFVKEVEI